VTRAPTGTEQSGAHGAVGGRADAGHWDIPGSATHRAGQEANKSLRSREGVLAEGAACSG